MEKLSSQANKSWGFVTTRSTGKNSHGDPAGWNERTLDRDLKHLLRNKEFSKGRYMAAGCKKSVTALGCPQSCRLRLGRGDLTIGSFGYHAGLDSIWQRRATLTSLPCLTFLSLSLFLWSLLRPLLLLFHFFPTKLIFLLFRLKSVDGCSYRGWGGGCKRPLFHEMML